MKIKYKISFPCGYTIDCNCETLLGISGFHFNDKDLPICPIHKDKCRRDLK